MTPSWYSRLALDALGRLPLHAISRAAGRFASLRLPGLLQRALIRIFGVAVGVDWSEVHGPVASFPSLQAFFTRPLAPGARPRDSHEDAFLAPCDGTWGASGLVEMGTLLQVKGQPYRLGELLGSEKTAAALEGGPYATIYLAPRDYHRFHTPLELIVSHASHFPGALWPVNPLGVKGVPRIFAINERICIGLHPPERPDLQLFIVAVGATMVGSVRVVFDDALGTNTAVSSPREHRYPELARIGRGEELGRFEFGSSLVVVASPGWIELDPLATGSPLRVGSRIGSVQSRAPASGQSGGTP